ncbi:Uncharacterized protein DAT39_002423, partial [Clarias magur]
HLRRGPTSSEPQRRPPPEAAGSVSVESPAVRTTQCYIGRPAWRTTQRCIQCSAYSAASAARPTLIWRCLISQVHREDPVLPLPPGC